MVPEPSTCRMEIRSSRMLRRDDARVKEGEVGVSQM